MADTSPAPDAPRLELHKAIGGSETWRRLATVFYARVDRDPRLRPLFPGKSLHCAIEELAAFLTQLFGGPGDETQRRWWLSLRESHLRFRIGQAERAAWMENMSGALDDSRIEEPFRSVLLDFFGQASAYVVNSGETVPAAAVNRAISPLADALRQEIAYHWDAQLVLDEAVAAIRDGRIDHVVAAAEILRVRFHRDRSVLVGLLALMIKSRAAALLRYAGERVTQDPALVRERNAGRTLLHDAAALGDVATVELLLRLGSDSSEQTAGNHTALYCLANECGDPKGAAVVTVLAQVGADLNACDGVKQCTPLHMAARRGHVEIAQALLDRGARIDPRDKLGDTPLRRAVNCNKVQVAALLLERGADANSIGSKGLTPKHAARTAAMKELFSFDLT